MTANQTTMAGDNGAAAANGTVPDGQLPADPPELGDGDDVVAEIDVMLSDELNDSLYLLQYPYRPRDQPPYRPDEITAINFKAEREQLEIQLAINTRGKNYDRRKSQAIATAANRPGESGKANESVYFPNGVMDRQRLRSSKPIGNGNESNLAVGRFERIRDADGKVTRSILHLAPIKNVLQMEATCEYLDTNKAQSGKTDGEQSTESKPVTVRFAGRESDRVKAIRARAYSQIKKKNAEEAWKSMGYRDMESPEAEHSRMQMLCPSQHDMEGASTTDNSNIFNVDGSEYASALTNQHAAGLRGDSLKSVRDKSLPDQVRYVLCNANIIRFDTLVETLEAGSLTVDRAQVLRAVQQCACLVQGNWVVKSEVVYPKDSQSGLLGLPCDTMRRSRNYLLVQLQNSSSVSKSQLTNTLRLPHEELDLLLTQLTVHEGHDSWRLKLARDENFLQANPDIVHRQNLIWEAIESGLSREFKEVRSITIGMKTATVGGRKRNSSKVTDPQ